MGKINEVLWDLRETYRAEPNPFRKQALQDEYDRALIAILDVTDKDIGANTAAFDKAVEGLEKSVSALRKAKRKIGDVAKVIKTIAKAVDQVVKVTKKIAGG